MQRAQANSSFLHAKQLHASARTVWLQGLGWAIRLIATNVVSLLTKHGRTRDLTIKETKMNYQGCYHTDSIYNLQK